jgi:NADH:ubiquinone oxidoreductase subunit 5 (subunit L)/multisubunit Na+/H+ antiporter MnhA subunit
MKLIHAIFLGQPSNDRIKNVEEVPLFMNIAPIVLALLCIIFGVFFMAISLRFIILPSIDRPVLFNGVWNSSLAVVFIFIGLLIGWIVYLLSNLKTRQVSTFIGGERLEDNSEINPSGVEFYNTVKEIPLLQFIYKKAQEKTFDIYEQGKKITFSLSALLQRLHNGILPTYIVWYLLGMIGLFYFLISR